MTTATRSVLLALCVLLAACGSGGSNDGGLMGSPGSGDFMAATIDGTSFRATRVKSRISSGTGGSLVVNFGGYEDPAGKILDFTLEFANGVPQTGTWTLAPNTTKSVHTSNIPSANDSCLAWWNSSVTVTRNDSSRIEGTFYIEAECTGSQFPPIEFIATGGSFSICLTSTCQGGWRNVS